MICICPPCRIAGRAFLFLPYFFFFVKKLARNVPARNASASSAGQYSVVMMKVYVAFVIVEVFLIVN